VKRRLFVLELCALSTASCVIQIGADAGAMQPTAAGAGAVVDVGGPRAGLDASVADVGQIPSGGTTSMPPMAGGGEPAPMGEWLNATGNLAGLASECGDLSALSAKPDEDLLIAGVAAQGLFASDDGGESWTALGQGADSHKVQNRAVSFVYDPDDSGTWWEAGIYGPGVYHTTNNGLVFKGVGDVGHVDTLAIDFSDARRRLLVAAGHEAAKVAYLSDDGGATWRSIGQTLPEAVGCQSITLLDAATFLIGCDYGGEGIYRTTDGGERWELVSAEGGARSPLKASDGSYYWARPGGGIVRSVDEGVSWSGVAADGKFKPLAPVELPDGRIAAVSTSGVEVSADQGAKWTRVTSALPFDDVSGFIYSSHRRAFYIKHFQCLNEGDVVLDDAIMRYDFDHAASR
jgi:hypothetical protein